MSNREKCIHMIDRLSEQQLGVIVSLLNEAVERVLEDEDNAFCEQLIEEYLASPNKGETISIEALASDLGIVL